MATTANLSRFHFARAFKASTGQAAYSTLVRSAWDNESVAGANQPLAQIALALNFSSPANFTRAFRREFWNHAQPVPGPEIT